MEIKAIGFDYGGVLAGESGVSLGIQMSSLMGITFDEYKTLYFKRNKMVQRDEISWDEFWKLFLNDLGMPDKYDQVMEINDSYHHKLGVINPEMMELVDLVRKNGFKTGLLSNNNRANADRLRRNKVDTHFDVFHISVDTGLVKPEPKAFSYFAECLGVELSELVFIDDSEKSLSTSEECGYTPVLFETYEKLKTQLLKLGVLQTEN